MIVNYIIREVKPHAAKVSSYREGKTLTSDHFDDREAADAYAARCNECCTLPGIRYFVLPHEETQPFPSDIHFPGARPCSRT